MTNRWPRPLRRRAVVCAVVQLLVVLWLDMFAALFGALAGYVLYELALKTAADDRPLSKRVGSALLAVGLVAGGALALVTGFHLLLNASTDGLPKLMQLLADTIDHIRNVAPDWLAPRLPESADELQHALANWLRSHGHDMQHWGRMVLRILAHLILGLIIGIAANASLRRRPATKPLPALAAARWRQLALAFSDVLAAQLRIALVNAGLTAFYLLAVLPAFGAHVP